ncbi:MAG: hypothetical protein ACTH2U_16520 [Brevibacterium sp.]
MTERLQCSAKACRTDATRAVLWNNPGLHTPERRKVWLACEEHLEYLRHFLDLRGFFIADVDIDAIPEGAG